MLIEFQVSNFRSFRERQTLSMTAGNLSDHLESNTFDSGVAGLPRLVRSSALYGPNAAGKTNLLRALGFVQAMVLHSAKATGDAITNYSPFKLDTASRNSPSEFKITFVQNRLRYEYGLSVGSTRVCREWLVEYVHPRGRTLFDRRYNDKKDTYDWQLSTFLKGTKEVWKDTTRPNALFLSIATQLNSRQLLPIFEWFQKRLVVIDDVTTMNAALTLNLLRDPEGKKRLLPFLREADSSIADVDAQREAVPLGSSLVVAGPGDHIVESRPGNEAPNLWRITLSHRGGANGSEMFGSSLNEESGGTQFLFQTAGAWLNVLTNGEVLCFDEVDRSLHPILVAFLLRRFHSNRHNPSNAQIIFTTHNTSLLRPQTDLLRRDQVWFVERGQNNGSALYPLTDFKPRNDAALEDGYLRGRYGALPLFPNLVE
jgi:hypothetical protein